MLAGIGYTLSNGVYPLLNNYLVNAFGWRNAFRVLAGSLCVVYVPVVILFMVSLPEDIGLNPDGLTGNDDNMAESFQDEECSFTQAQAMRTWAFWILAFCFFQLSLGATGVTFHFLSIFAERGYSDVFAAQVLSVKPLTGFAATILVGLFLDRWRRPQLVLTAALAAQCAGTVMLVFLSGTAMAYIYTVLSGVSEAVIMLSISVLRPLPFGSAYDLLSGYREIVLFIAVLPAVAAVLSLFIRKSVHPI